ncbi:hypothetical protein, partial [Leptolyngbya sp. PCC 6406]|uniref:hypothetical protein n=1 Tax=Leptolyngbya sp. PCC 6406 TaxID=1173264 RepID=UPI001CEC1FED
MGFGLGIESLFIQSITATPSTPHQPPFHPSACSARAKPYILPPSPITPQGDENDGKSEGRRRKDEWDLGGVLKVF